jgi:ribonuclease D
MNSPQETRRPNKVEISQLPPYSGLPSRSIRVVQSDRDEQRIVDEIATLGVVGLDTETKPVFARGERPDGPHVIQLATLNQVFIFQVHRRHTNSLLKELLESPHLLKVGFGLNSDRGPLLRKLGISLQNYADVSKMFRPFGFRQKVGVKAAVAIIFEERLQKSKSITTSNWAREWLSAQQLQYAAEDAHASLAVFLAMGCPVFRKEPQVEPGIADERVATKALVLESDLLTS